MLYHIDYKKILIKYAIQKIYFVASGIYIDEATTRTHVEKYLVFHHNADGSRIL